MPSLADAFLATARRRDTAAALLCDGTTYSFRDLGERAAAVAAALATRQVKPGDRVAVGLPNSAELVATVLGVIHAGAVLVPLNPASTADEVAYVVGDSGSRVAVVADEQAADLMNAHLPELSVIASSLEVPGAAARAAIPPIAAEAPALIVYTSGTTGRPKGAVLSHRALLSNLTTVARAWQWTERDRLLLTLPCFHLHGLGLGILCSFLVGSSVVLRQRFVAEEIFAELERSQATMFFGVPTMYNRLLALPDDLFVRALPHVRLWVSGSAALSAATFERFEQRCGQQLLDRYGMTECGFVLSGSYGGVRRPGVVGLPLPGIAVRIVDPGAADGGRLIDVADGAVGEIVVCGPNLFSGYWNRPEETRRAFVGGHLRSGDLAVREADGAFRVVGRSSVDIIKSRGFKIGAGEIEDCIQRHPLVQEVAVVGLPDADQGERVVAAVTLVPGAEVAEEAIRAFTRRHLAPHKLPSEVVFVDDIPRTGPGKFKKKELIERLSASR